MADLLRPQKSLRHGLPALFVVGALALTSCSASSGDSTATGDDRVATTAPSDRSSKRSTTTEPGKVSSGKAVLHLPLDGDAPTGHRMVTEQCDLNVENRDEDADASERYASPIVFAVPTDWTSKGRSSGGSGSVTGTGIGLIFESAVPGDVKVEYDWDRRDDQGEVLGNDREPWKSFDLTTKVGDKTYQVTYDKVAEVTVGKQDVELFHRDASTTPDYLSADEYKARVTVAEFPKPVGHAKGTDTYSFVVTVSIDRDVTGITQKDVEAIIGSLSMPTCVWDDLLLDEENHRKIDLNGDGKVKSDEEIQQELQDKLDELRKQAETEK